MTICIHCHEPILATDRRAPFYGDMHWECGLRMTVGGVNHLNGLCICCGGTLQPDPEDVTTREAARMATELWFARHDSIDARDYD